MRADICTVSDEKTVEKFWQVLERLGAKLVQRHDTTLGVTISELMIDKQRLTVYSDIWLSIDIAGPANIVRHIVSEYNKERKHN